MINDNRQGQQFADVKKERTFDAQINNTISHKYKQQQPMRTHKDGGGFTGPQQKLKIKMQGSFQHNFSSQSSSSKAIAGVTDGSSIHLAQSSGQLILFPNKRPVAGTTVVSADASPRGASAAAHGDSKQGHTHGQMQKLSKHGKASVTAGTKSAGKQGATSGPATAMSTPVNFSPSADNGAQKQRKVVVVGSRATFQQQIHHSSKAATIGPGPQTNQHPGSKQQFRQSNQQQLRKILRNNLVSVQLGDTDQGSTGRGAEGSINKRNDNGSLVLKNSYCPETQTKYFEAQNSLGSALVSRTQQVNPGSNDYHGQQYISMNMARAPAASATGKANGNMGPVQYNTVGAPGQPIPQQSVKQAMQATQQIYKQQAPGSTGNSNTFVSGSRGGSKKLKVQQQQRVDKPMINKPQVTKQSQAKSFMLREKDVHFTNQFYHPPGRLSVSKQPGMIKSRDSSMENVNMNDEEELDLDQIHNQNPSHNPESPKHMTTVNHQINYQPGMKQKVKVATDSYSSKMLNSMLRRGGGEQEYSEDRSSNQPGGQSRAAATGLITLKGFGSATGYRTAQVSAQVSALTSKNNSNNSSQVRPQQFNGTANLIGNKIFYHGPSSISGSTSGNQQSTIGTQLQKHGQMGSTLKQQKKHQVAHPQNMDNTTQSVSHQVTRIAKKSTVIDKKVVPGSISQDMVEQNNFSGLTSGTTTILRKHGIVSHSNSKLTSFHSNQVTGGAQSRESSFKQKKHDKYDSQISSTGNRFKFDASHRQSQADEESTIQKNQRAHDANQFKGSHATHQSQNTIKSRTNSTHQQRQEENRVARVQSQKTPIQSQTNSIKKKALQPSHPSQSQGGHKGNMGNLRVDRSGGVRNDGVTPSHSNKRQPSGGPRNVLTPATNINTTGEKIQASSTQYQTPIQVSNKLGNQRHNSPLRNVIEYRDKNNLSVTDRRSGKQQNTGQQDEDKKSNSSMNSQKLQMQQYYNDIKQLKDHIKVNFGQAGVMMKSTSEFYRIGRVLGRGAFGKVNLACHKISEHLVAIKSIEYAVLRNEKEHKRRLMQEMSILKQSAHQNVVKLYDSFETNKHMCFVMELCQGGDLLSYVRKRRKLKEDNAKYLFKQMVSGLHYIHQRKFVVHRDIKLDNILIDQSGQIKICDFGVSKQLKSEKEKMHEQCGTPAYVAPEVIGQKGYRGFKADMWSAGVCLYVMLLGTVPFRSNTMEELHKLILKGRFDFQGEKLSDEAKDLICGLIQVNYRKRLTAKQALNHPWLQSTQEGNEPIDINRSDLADVIFTENEKQNIKNHYLCRLEKLKRKRFNQRKKIIHQNEGKNQMNQSQTGKGMKGSKGQQQSNLEYKMQQQMQRTFTEGDFIFTEHNLDTKEDEIQERKTVKERLQQKEKINDLFKKSPRDSNGHEIGGQGVFNKFDAFDIKPKTRHGSLVSGVDSESVANKILSVPLKNISEKSIIYAPFNSSFTDFDEDQPQLFKWPSEVLDIMQPKRSKIIRFSKRCRDLNREYEENNNADLDNGVYNAFVNEQEMEAERQQQEEMMLQAKKDEEMKSGNKLNNSVCDIDSNGMDPQRSSQPNIVLNLNGLKQNQKGEKSEIFKIEEKNGIDGLNSLNSFSDSENDDFSPQISQHKDVKRGFNVSPSSMIDGKHRSRAANDNGSLNSSRMTGTQELSIHEGMQVMHEMEQNHQSKKNAKGQKSKKTNQCSEVVFNIGSLNTDNQKTLQDNTIDNSKAEQDIEIDDNVVHYTIEQFLEENNGTESELKSQNKNSSRIEKKSNIGANASNRSSNRHANLFQVGSQSKNSLISATSKNKFGSAHESSTINDNQDYYNYRSGTNGGSRPTSQTNKHNQQSNNPHAVNKSQKELPSQAMAHNMKVQLYHCLRTHNLNYLTAAYFLTQKHEFS